MNPARNDAGATSVGLQLFATVREAVGKKFLSWAVDDRATVREVLADLEAEHPALAGSLLDDSGDLQPTVAVVLNGRNVVQLDGLDTTLADGDTLAVMPPVSGGVG